MLCDAGSRPQSHYKLTVLARALQRRLPFGGPWTSAESSLCEVRQLSTDEVAREVRKVSATGFSTWKTAS